MKHVAGLVLAAMVCVAGCAGRQFSNTPRTAIEQMILTRAVDLALEKFEMPELAGAKVYPDFTNLKATDAEYIKVATRARLAKIGATLVEKADEADFVAEIASGALGTEFKKSMIGLPSIPVPNAGVPMPEMAFHKSIEQTGIVKLLIFVHAEGKFVAANHYYAKADRDESFTLFWRHQKADDIREGWERADLNLGTGHRSPLPTPKMQTR